MLSTYNMAGLPPAPALQQLAQSLAVLDALNSPEWEYRYYSYNPAWGPDEAALTMRDGEGDELLVLFRPEGCVLNGYLEDIGPLDKSQLTRGLPAAFEEFLFGEPVAGIGTTFCLWYTPTYGWQAGLLPPNGDDGSEDLLGIFDGRPETYAAWATEYYTDETDRPPVPAEAVAAIYRHEVLTRKLALAINPELEDFVALAAELQELGYRYDFN